MGPPNRSYFMKKDPTVAPSSFRDPDSMMCISQTNSCCCCCCCCGSMRSTKDFWMDTVATFSPCFIGCSPHCLLSFFGNSPKGLLNSTRGLNWVGSSVSGRKCSATKCWHVVLAVLTATDHTRWFLATGCCVPDSGENHH